MSSLEPTSCVMTRRAVWHDFWARLRPAWSRRKPKSNLVKSAEEELDAIGMGDPDADYDGALKGAVLDIIRLFAKQGHSGFSAAMVTGMVEKLMRYEPLSPLTGADEEWQVLDYAPDMAAQNRRCSHVFKRADGTAYDIDARVFRSPEGDTYSGGKHGRTDITFPYTPAVEYIDVDEYGEPIGSTS